MALIDSSMFGIPFEGYDYYQNGSGGMKGVIAKAITLFDQTGEIWISVFGDLSCRKFICPYYSIAGLYITFEEISSFEVRATINYKGQTASGIFTFNEQYEMISFTTKDRAVAGTDGSMQYIPWSALCGDYQVSTSGIKHPSKFQAVWNYPDGDFVYFDGLISEVSYGNEE
jgi:hypothetical protein